MEQRKACVGFVKCLEVGGPGQALGRRKAGVV